MVTDWLVPACGTGAGLFQPGDNAGLAKEVLALARQLDGHVPSPQLAQADGAVFVAVGVDDDVVQVAQKVLRRRRGRSVRKHGGERLLDCTWKHW